MNAGQSFRLAIKALTTSKMRSLLTMLGIIIGVASVIVILALGNGVQGMIDEQVDKLGINMMQTYVWGRGDGSTMDLDPSDMYDLVEANPDVLTGVSPYVSFQATLRHGDQKFDQTQLYGVSEVMFNSDTQSTMDGGQKLTRGRFLSYLDVARRQNVCVIGAYLAQEAFGGDAQALGQTLSINGTSYTVIGVLDRLNTTTEMAAGGSDDQIYIPYENALQIMGARYVTLYVFTSTSGETAAQAKAIIDGMLYDHFQGDEDAYYTTTMEEQANLINAMMGVVMGKVIFQKHSQEVAPSMLAASYILSGMELSPARKIKICTPERIKISVILVTAAEMKSMIPWPTPKLVRYWVNTSPSMVLKKDEAFSNTPCVWALTMPLVSSCILMNISEERITVRKKMALTTPAPLKGFLSSSATK